MTLQPNRYHLQDTRISSFPRKDGQRGAGLALVMKDYIYVIENMEYTVTVSMECVHTNIKVNNTCICLYIIYRILNTSVLLFCEELAQLFEKYFQTDTQNTILLGDLNIHMDDLQHPDTTMFNDFLDSFNLKKSCLFSHSYFKALFRSVYYRQYHKFSKQSDSRPWSLRPQFSYMYH